MAVSADNLDGTQAIAPTPELQAIARRLFWWGPRHELLLDRIRFVAQVMNLGTWVDICAVRQCLGEAVFGEVLDRPPPGVFTARRWNYWHVRLGRLPVPRVPERFPA